MEGLPLSDRSYALLLPTLPKMRVIPGAFSYSISMVRPTIQELSIAKRVLPSGIVARLRRQIMRLKKKEKKRQYLIH
ncbi:hypothetical protein AFLA_009350 [Aspergillus flavus NRRL3357]|nr:hypothetical protein AFLA_009350 [Aspergillus flavus NRRL3357]